MGVILNFQPIGYNNNMSYSQLILSEKPSGYWESPSLGTDNLLTANQYSLESSTAGWSAVDSNTTVSRYTTDKWIGNASLKATAASASQPIATRFSSGSRVKITPGLPYTFVARVKSLSGSRSVSTRVEYFTTQSGSTLSEPVRSGNTFQISNSKWTEVYHTDYVSTPPSSDYFASFGIVSSASGSVGDSILIDGVQFYQGTAHQLLDRVFTNDSDIINFNNENIKPIVFNSQASTKLLNNSLISIKNNYKLFISGAESKPASIDFWFAIEQPPSFRHNLITIGTFLKCYIERDRIYIQSGDKVASTQVLNWDSQHYVSIVYANKKIDLYLDDRSPTSIILGDDFSFSDSGLLSFSPSIVFGPSSQPRNLVLNPDFEDGTVGWNAQNSSIQTITSDRFSGSQCLEINKSSQSNSGISLYEKIRVEPYQKYFVSAYVKIPTSNNQSTLSLVCEEHDGISGSLVNSTTASLSVSSSSGWTRLSLEIYPDIYSKYIDIKIVQEVAGTANQKFLVDAVLVQKSDYEVAWDSNSKNSDPLFVSCIGLYPYPLTISQMQNHYNYGSRDASDQLSIRYAADRINPQYNKSIAVQQADMSNVDAGNQLNISNFIYSENGLGTIEVAPAKVTVGPLGGSYSLSLSGISFSGDTYIDIADSYPTINMASSTITLQVIHDDSSGDGVLLATPSIFGYFMLTIEKIDNCIVGRMYREFDDSSPTELFSSNTLSSGDVNIAINFQSELLSVLINENEFNDMAIPASQNPSRIYLGGYPGANAGYPDKIRNFSINNLTGFNSIDWLSPALFTLRFYSSLNVAKKASFEYLVQSLGEANNSIISFNNACKPVFLVNGGHITDTYYIPGYDYASPQPFIISGYVTTEDSNNDTPVINNIYLSTYNSTSITSSLGKYELRTNVDQNDAELSNPYIIKPNSNNLLSHDPNLGLLFDRDYSTGCRIVKASADYEAVEFVVKINKGNNYGETYTIFDINGVASLYYSDNKFIKSGTYDLYIDGKLISSISDFTILVNEIYHIVVKFNSVLSTDIHLGKDSSLQNGLNGTVGSICIFESAPVDMASYASDKYQDLIGHVSLSITGGGIIATDEPISQSYFRDDAGDYYEMLDLPKVKFVLSSWEEIDIQN